MSSLKDKIKQKKAKEAEVIRRQKEFEEKKRKEEHIRQQKMRKEAHDQQLEMIAREAEAFRKAEEAKM